MIQSSPERTALVARDARSEPASGSLKPWHHTISPLRMRGRNSCFCSSVPHCNNVGPTRISPSDDTRIGAFARANSSLSTTCSTTDNPRPPYCFGHEAQTNPPSKSLPVHSAMKASRSVVTGRLSRIQVRTSAPNATASGGYRASIGSEASRQHPQRCSQVSYSRQHLVEQGRDTGLDIALQLRTALFGGTDHHEIADQLFGRIVGIAAHAIEKVPAAEPPVVASVGGHQEVATHPPARDRERTLVVGAFGHDTDG